MNCYTTWSILLAQLLLFGERNYPSQVQSRTGKEVLLTLENPDLGKLKKENFRLMAFGDGMIAGWRDGGLFRKGQQTAFPNLVANQMGLADFRSPLFDEANSNGTGYLILNSSASGPRWQKVEGNSTTVSQDIPVLTPYNGEEVHNMGIPKINQGSLTGVLSPKSKGWVYGDTQKGYASSMPFFWRIFPQADPYKVSYYDEITTRFKAKTMDLALISFGYDEWTDTVIKSEHTNLDPISVNTTTNSTTLQVALKAKENGIETVVYTLPNFRHLAYFNWYTQNTLAQFKGKATISIRRNSILGTIPLSGDLMFIPTPAIEEMFERVKKGERFNITLSDADVIDTNEIQGGSPILYNQRIRREAAAANIPVVDLEAIYQKIYDGGYTTDDGLLINGSPQGNFFSADGLYPSAIGNAVIANETIKVLNQHYAAHIPLVNVSLFSKSLK